MIYMVLMAGAVIGCVCGSCVYNYIEDWKEKH